MAYSYSTMVERIVVGQLNTNTYLFSSWKKECIIIDVGGNPQKIIAQMTMKNLHPRGIVFTHGHIDHVSACGEILAHYKSLGIEVKTAIHSLDAHYLGKNGEKTQRETLSALKVPVDELIEELLHPLPEPDILLSEGDTVFESDLTVIHTPGHTKGSISLYSPSQGVLFSGDTLFFEGVGRTDMKDGDAQAIIASIKNKLITLPPETRVFPGHGPFTTIEREVKNNPYIR